MRVIQPNCRIQFTADDIEFITATLGARTGARDCLIQLLADEETRDQILDDEALFHALLEQRACLRVSTHFYFYILVRHVLRRAGIEDRNVADYVAEVLTEYSHTDRTTCYLPSPGGRQARPLDYFFEMLAALQTADDRTAFVIRAHIGNHSLFLSGVFLQRIRHRAETRGFPGLHYYEALGSASYRQASDHRLAVKYDLAPIFATLAERFQTTRLALNDLAERLVSLNDVDFSLETLLKSSSESSAG